MSFDGLLMFFFSMWFTSVGREGRVIRDESDEGGVIGLIVSFIGVSLSSLCCFVIRLRFL